MTPGVLAALATTVFLWASLFVATRAAVPYYGPTHLTLLRFLVASLSFGVVLLVVGARRPARSDWPMLVSSGLLGITVCTLGIAYGTQTVKAGSASMIASLAPVVAALLATVVLGERLGGRGWLGIALGVAGVGTIAFGEGGGLRLEFGAGVLALAAIAQGISFVIQKPGFARFSPLELTGYTMWIGTLPMLVFLPGLPESIQTAPLDATLAILYLGVVPGAVAYYTWSYALSRIPASRAASFLYLVPVLSTGLGWAYLSELPAALSFLGGALTLSGVFLVNARRSPAPTEQPPPSAQQPSPSAVARTTPSGSA